MANQAKLKNVGRQYADAYAAHYTGKNLLEALELYKGIVNAHPDSKEAGYSRSQLMNIVHGVVPARELLDVQVELASGRLEREKANGAEPVRTGPSGRETDDGDDPADDTSR